MASTIPISKTNVVTTIGHEPTEGTSATKGMKIAYDSNAFSRQQTLEKNVELRGTRQMGTRVPGPRAPGGGLTGHQTDQTIVLDLWAMLGGRTSTEVGACGILLTVTQSATVGSTPPESGAHSYAVIISKGGAGTTKKTLHSALAAVLATITADGTHKVHIARSGGSLPTGWTWALYRTAAAADPAVVANYKVITGAEALGAAVLTFDDDLADASLGSAMPTTSDTGYGDHKHILKIADVLPSFTVERMLPYVSDAAAYFLGLGSKMNTGSIQVKSTGFFDITGTWASLSFDGSGGSSFDASALDWRAGEKLHHAMIGAASVKVGPSGGSLSAFAKFEDFKIDHNNNLYLTDQPVGLQGNRGSLVGLQAETQFSGNIKVTDPDVMALIQDLTLHDMSIEWDFATYGHSVKAELFGVQFDPTDPQVTGQGILIIPFTGFASQPVGAEQVVFTVVNGIGDSVYTGA